MDEPVPVIDFSPSGSTDSEYSLERGDVDGMHNHFPFRYYISYNELQF